jgi:hypothetical protein
MSVEIATMGMFKSCCYKGGGAPPINAIREEAETPMCQVTIHKVYFEDLKTPTEIEIKIFGGVTMS